MYNDLLIFKYEKLIRKDKAKNNKILTDYYITFYTNESSDEYFSQIKKNRKIWYSENKEKNKEKCKRYRENNKDKINMNMCLHRQLKKKNRIMTNLEYLSLAQFE